MADNDHELSARAVWAALRQGKSRTLDDLQILTDELGSIFINYLNALCRAGYVRFEASGRATSGETLVAFRLVKNTGLMAPLVQRDGTLHDPNLAEPLEGRRISLVNRVRAALRTRGPAPVDFGMVELQQAAGIRRTEIQTFRNAVFHLAHLATPEVERIDLKTVRWLGDDDHPRERIRRLLMGAHRPITVEDMRAELGCEPRPVYIRAACEMLRAAGWQVHQSGSPTAPAKRRQGKRQRYVAIPPENWSDAQ